MAREIASRARGNRGGFICVQENSLYPLYSAGSLTVSLHENHKLNWIEPVESIEQGHNLITAWLDSAPGGRSYDQN